VSLLSFACGVSPVPLIPQEVAHLPLQSTVVSIFTETLNFREGKHDCFYDRVSEHQQKIKEVASKQMQLVTG
jgi:hypothetical protein